MIIGSFPIGKFSDPDRKGEIKETEIDFYFGGERNLLWKILSLVFDRPLTNKKSIQNFLREKGIGIGDVIKSCVRREGRASDTDLIEIEWNLELLEQIRRHKIQKVYFTSQQVEKWFKRLFPEARDLESITLLSPSGQTARGLWRREDYQSWRKSNPENPTLSYLVQTYKEVFNS